MPLGSLQYKRRVRRSHRDPAKWSKAAPWADVQARALPRSAEWNGRRGDFAPVFSRTATPWNNFLIVERRRGRIKGSLELCPDYYWVLLHLGPSDFVEYQIASESVRREAHQSGDLCLLSRGVPLRVFECSASELVSLGLAPRFITAVASRTNARGNEVELSSGYCVDPTIQHIILALRAELSAGCPGGRVYGEAFAAALAAQLVRHHSAVLLTTAEHSGGLSPARLRRVFNHIDGHLNTDVSLKMLASVAELSPHHFATAFKQSTGLPPHQYVLQRRIAKAKDLLTENQISLADIAYSLGFPSQSHFTTLFRRFTGATPRRYRDRVGTAGDAYCK